MLDRKYDEVEKIGFGISDNLKKIFLKERLLYGEMIELLLESFKPLERDVTNTSEGDLALTILASRIFNDSEGAKHLLLLGLPDQSLPIIRDIIECTLLFRLFLNKPKSAKKWLISSGEYHPKKVYDLLLSDGINAKEYAMYGELSHTGHTNLLASLSHIQETIVDNDKMLRMVHFGSCQTNETQFFIRWHFISLFLLLFNALFDPLSDFYKQHANKEVYKKWYDNVFTSLLKLRDLFSETSALQIEQESLDDTLIKELINKKMRYKEFISIMTRDESSQ